MADTMYTSDSAPADGGQQDSKKQKVIHARVSETLERELKQHAGSLGVSVSNLVRNILQRTVGLVEEMMVDCARSGASCDRMGAVRDTVDEARVVAWQEATLNRATSCDRCQVALPRGIRAAVAIVDGPGRRPVLCDDCLSLLGRDTDIATAPP